MASRFPVEAPEGIFAVALAPLDRVAVTARVGLPGVQISSASSLRISGMAHAFPARRSSKASGSPRCFCARRDTDTPSALLRDRMRLSLSFVWEILAGTQLPDRIPVRVIICPSGWQIPGWAAVKGELLHHLLSLCKTWLVGLSTKPYKANVPKGHADSAFLQETPWPLPSPRLTSGRSWREDSNSHNFASVMKSTQTAFPANDSYRQEESCDGEVPGFS